MRVLYSAVILRVISLLTLMTDNVSALSPPNRNEYTNPVLAGWHSDPSCIYVAEEDTNFCIASTFIAFPGLPIYATKDFQNWKLASNVFNRRSQIPSLAQTDRQQGGIYAPTLRYHEGKYYVIVSFLGPETIGLVFTSTDPYDDAAWSEPLEFPVRGIDPDIFWDDDGTVYVTSAENQMIPHYSLDLDTGLTGPVSYLWNGTGGVWPEGPHIYRHKGDDYYYLLIAEGGTELDHAVMMARSRNLTGPWEPCPRNPVLSNRNTTQFFQTVGHADIFQDGRGNWWTSALGTRSGPAFLNYPMGRETVLVPATWEWEKGEWPVIEPVRGRISTPQLPRPDRKSLEAVGVGEGFAGDPDRVDFKPGSSIPAHFMYWRFPKEEHFTVSPRGHPNTLRLTPSVNNLTGTATFEPDDGITFVGRRQTDTLFTYGVDVSFDPTVAGEEAGVTLFLTQYQHVDLGIVLLPSAKSGKLDLSFRFRIEGRGNFNGTIETPKIVSVPKEWKDEKIRLEIQAVSDKLYVFSAALASKPGKKQVLGRADSLLVSGDTGHFTGSLVGVYATSNGGNGTREAYISRWRYDGQGQMIDDGVVV